MYDLGSEAGRIMPRRCWPLLVFVSVGCTHIRVAEFDTQNRTFTVAGGRRASSEDFEEKAREFCAQSNSKPILLGCGEGSRAKAATVDNRGNVSATVVNPHDAYRCRYQCEAR